MSEEIEEIIETLQDIKERIFRLEKNCSDAYASVDSAIDDLQILLDEEE